MSGTWQLVYRRAVQFDRWVVPPAVAAAVFTTMAVVPPGGREARGLRVEVAGEPVAGRPLLVRLTVEDAGTPRWRPPSRAILALRSSDGVVTRTSAAAPPRGVPYLFVVIPAASGRGPWSLAVDAEGYAGRATLREGERTTFVPSAPEPGDQGAQLAIEGGALVPEVPGVLVLAVQDGAGRSVAVAPSDASLRIDPPRATLDACGVARVTATVQGLDAHVAVTVSGAAERVVNRRLAVVPGALALRGAPGEIVATTAVGGQPVYVLAGDAHGATYWTAASMAEPSGENAAARVALPAPADWALASLSAAFEQAQGEWLRAPPGATGCTATALGGYYARVAVGVPPPPGVRRVFDGAAIALAEREARKDHARRIALALAAAAMAMLVGLVLTAGLRRDPAGLEQVSVRARHRVLFAVAGAAALLVGGLVLLTAYVLRL